MARSVRQQRHDLAADLRAEGKTWVEIGRALRERWPDLTPRAALRLAHTKGARCWTQQDAADAWARRWPDGRAPEAKEISRWETWPRPGGKRPSFDTLDRLAQIYQCRVADLLVDISDHRHLDTATGNPPAVAPPSRAPELPERLDTSEPWLVLDTMTRSNISAATVDEMEAAMWRSAERFPTAPAGPLARETGALLSRTHGALSQPQAVCVRYRLVRLLGYLGGLLASLRFDESDTDTTVRGWFRVAGHAAAEAEDNDLASWLLAHEALVSHLSGRPAHDTYRLLAAADDHARRNSGRRRQAWVMALRARSAGVLGEAGEAVRLLDEAHSTLRSAGPVEGPDFFDEPRFVGMRGTTLLHLGHLDAADEALRSALDSRAESQTRGRAWLTLDLATCYARQGEIEEAARLSEVGLDLAGGPIRSITSRARSVIDEVMRAGGTQNLVDELTERVIASERSQP